MANQALAYFYPNPGWPQPGADLVHEPAAAADALNPQNAAVPAIDGFQLDLDQVLVDARARRKHVTKVLVFAALQLLTALALLFVFRLVPDIKFSFFRKDITASDPKDEHGHQEAPFANRRMTAQLIIGMMFAMATFINIFLPRDPPMTRNQHCTIGILMVLTGLLAATAAATISVWTPPVAVGISFTATTVLMLLCSLLACRIKCDVSASGPWWMVGMFVFCFLWILGATIYSMVTHWEHRKFVFVSFLVGANLIIASHFMWDYQLVFGGRYERCKRIASCHWIVSSTLLSTVMLTHCLLNVLSVKWILFGWDHIGYSQ